MFGLFMFIAAIFIVWLYISSGWVVGLFATLAFLLVLYVKRFTAIMQKEKKKNHSDGLKKATSTE